MTFILELGNMHSERWHYLTSILWLISDRAGTMNQCLPVFRSSDLSTIPQDLFFHHQIRVLQVEGLCLPWQGEPLFIVLLSMRNRQTRKWELGCSNPNFRARYWWEYGLWKNRAILLHMALLLHIPEASIFNSQGFAEKLILWEQSEFSIRKHILISSPLLWETTCAKEKWTEKGAKTAFTYISKWPPFGKHMDDVAGTFTKHPS